MKLKPKRLSLSQSQSAASAAGFTCLSQRPLELPEMYIGPTDFTRVRKFCDRGVPEQTVLPRAHSGASEQRLTLLIAIV